MTTDRKKVFLVDDNISNLHIGKSMLHSHYQVFAMPSAVKMFEALGKVIPDIILLDIDMPVMNGYEAIKKLKTEPQYADIPVIFLSSRNDEESIREGLRLGAFYYVHKPYNLESIINYIEAAIIKNTNTK